MGVGEPRIGIGRVPRTFDVTSTPHGTTSELQARSPPANRVKLPVARSAKIGRHDLREVVAERKNVPPPRGPIGQGSGKGIETGAGLEVVDRHGSPSPPRSDGDALPVSIGDDVGHARDRVGPKQHFSSVSKGK